MSISAMKQALQALDLIDKDIEWHDKSPTRKFCNQAAHFLRQAIAEAEQPDLARIGEVGVWGDDQALAEPANSTTSVVEPVVWIEKHKDYLAVSADPFENAIPVYTSPLKCEWVELTHIEIGNLWAESQEVYSFAKAIEVKLKEKNT